MRHFRGSANHTLVDGIMRIAVDIAHFTATQMHAYAAAARAHGTSGSLDFERLVEKLSGRLPAS
jgi:hypothetical protein